MNYEYRAALDNTPTRTRCAFCRWTHTGTAAEGRQRAAKHRAIHHPTVKATRRRQNHLAKWRAEDSWRSEGLERAAEVAAMLRRREREAVA